MKPEFAIFTALSVDGEVKVVGKVASANETKTFLQ
jgi:hypothetical protein